MSVTWIVSNLDHKIADGAVIAAHWQAVDSEVVDGVIYSGRSYGTCGFSPDPAASSYVPYADITQEMAVGWAKDSLGEGQVASIEAAIVAQIEESISPITASGTPW
jgi:hypothetical protein|tara:strand:+ start:87 stop:404 length:318 start_codon:yes stop_codon:yes gene_type:complete